MTSTIRTDLPFATTVHSLARLASRTPDRAFLRDQLAEAEAALAALAAALENPFGEIGDAAHRAHLAAIVLSRTLASTAEVPCGLHGTVERMLEVLGPLVQRKGANHNEITTHNFEAPRPITDA